MLTNGRRRRRAPTASGRRRGVTAAADGAGHGIIANGYTRDADGPENGRARMVSDRDGTRSVTGATVRCGCCCGGGARRTNATLGGGGRGGTVN